MRIPVLSTCLVLLIDPSGALGQGRPGTSASLKAMEVTKHIRVHKEGSEIRFTLDDDIEDKSGDKLQSGQAFVTRRVLKVTYQELNPLKTHVSVKVQAVENAAAATLARLIEAIAGIPGIVKPELAGRDTNDAAFMMTNRMLATGAPAAAQCEKEVTAALAYVSILDRTLFGPLTSADRLKTEYGEWADAITKGFDDGKRGTAAIQDGTAAIDKYAGELKEQIDDAAKAIGFVDEQAAEGATDTCDRYAVAVFEFIRLTNPHARLAQLRTLQKAVADLRTALSIDFGQGSQWLGRDYIAAKDVTVSEQNDADVVVEASDLTVAVSDASISVKQGTAASASFTIQLDTGWVVEPNVGLTAGFVTRPKFGTSTNAAGETIVAEMDDDRVSIDPTILVNFIPRNGTALLRPMLQIGAAASKDSPALFIGGGWRLFGGSTGGVSFGGGLMLAWVKDLDALAPGDLVTGTTDIEADVKFDWARPKPRPYFSLQYRF